MTNKQLSPMTNDQRTIMNDNQRTQMTNDQGTPITNDQQALMTNKQRSPMTSERAPPYKKLGALVNDDRWTPPSGLQMPNDVTPLAKVARSGKPKATAQLFSGMQAPGYTTLLAEGVDDNDDLSFLRSICHSYDCSEDANGDDMRYVETGTCSMCTFFLKRKTRTLGNNCKASSKSVAVSIN